MKKTLAVLSIFIAVLCAACSFGSQQPAPGVPSAPKKPYTGPKREAVKVVRAVDGDTIIINVNGKHERLRMIGMDTPETVKEDTPVQYYGPEAHEYTEKQLAGKTVYLEFDVGKHDRFKRYLAYIWLDAEETDVRKMFNARLVLEGYARLLTMPPNVRYADYFKKYIAEARDNKRGMWQKAVH